MELAAFTERDVPELIRLARQARPELSYLDAKGWKAQLFADPDRDDAYLLKAVDKKTMIGAALGVARRADGGKSGWIKFAAVSPKARRQGVARALFSELERRFQKRDCTEVRVGACPPPYVDGGVPILSTEAFCFLSARGYERGGTIVDMVSDLKRLKPLGAGDLKTLKALGGRKAGKGDADALRAMVRGAFPYWAWEVDAALDHGVVWVAGLGGTVTAFACADGTHPGWFGPMGTLESERGKGQGRLLMAQCLLHLKKKGHQSARIPWVGPVPFYARYAAAALGPVYWTFLKRI
jgi:GNAT superfamily N-acetyltransferase